MTLIFEIFSYLFFDLFLVLFEKGKRGVVVFALLAIAILAFLLI